MGEFAGKVWETRTKQPKNGGLRPLLISSGRLEHKTVQKLKKRPKKCGKSPKKCGKSPKKCGKSPKKCGKSPKKCGKSPKKCGKIRKRIRIQARNKHKHKHLFVFALEAQNKMSYKFNRKSFTLFEIVTFDKRGLPDITPGLPSLLQL